MFCAFLRPWSHTGEIIERLVVVLKVRHRHSVIPEKCRLPSSAIPGPTDPFGRKQIANRLLSLGWEGGRVGGIGQGWISACCRSVGAGLVRRLHGINCVKIRRQITVCYKFWNAVNCRLW